MSVVIFSSFSTVAKLATEPLAQGLKEGFSLAPSSEAGRFPMDFRSSCPRASSCSLRNLTKRAEPLLGILRSLRIWICCGHPKWKNWWSVQIMVCKSERFFQVFVSPFDTNLYPNRKNSKAATSLAIQGASTACESGRWLSGRKTGGIAWKASNRRNDVSTIFPFSKSWALDGFGRCSTLF